MGSFCCFKSLNSSYTEQIFRHFILFFKLNDRFLSLVDQLWLELCKTNSGIKSLNYCPGVRLLCRYPRCWTRLLVLGPSKERFLGPWSLITWSLHCPFFIGSLQTEHCKCTARLGRSIWSSLCPLGADRQKPSAAGADCTQNSGQTRGAQGEEKALSAADSEDVKHSSV